MHNEYVLYWYKYHEMIKSYLENTREHKNYIILIEIILLFSNHITTTTQES